MKKFSCLILIVFLTFGLFCFAESPSPDNEPEKTPIDVVSGEIVSLSPEITITAVPTPTPTPAPTMAELITAVPSPTAEPTETVKPEEKGTFDAPKITPSTSGNNDANYKAEVNAGALVFWVIVSLLIGIWIGIFIGAKLWRKKSVFMSDEEKKIIGRIKP